MDEGFPIDPDEEGFYSRRILALLVIGMLPEEAAQLALQQLFVVGDNEFRETLMTTILTGEHPLLDTGDDIDDTETLSEEDIEMLVAQFKTQMDRIYGDDEVEDDK